MAISRLLTIDDVERLPGDGRWDLIEGELLRMPPTGEEHTGVSRILLRRLFAFLDDHPLGDLFLNEQGFILQRDPDTLVAPDIAFVRSDRLRPPGERRGFVPYAPDLAVEIVSPSDRRREIEAKVRAYMHAGTPMLWLINHALRTVTVYRPGEPPQTLAVHDALHGDEVLPGFQVPVGDLFR